MSWVESLRINCGFDDEQVKAMLMEELKPDVWQLVTHEVLISIGVNQMGRRLKFFQMVNNYNTLKTPLPPQEPPPSYVELQKMDSSLLRDNVTAALQKASLELSKLQRNVTVTVFAEKQAEQEKVVAKQVEEKVEHPDQADQEKVQTMQVAEKLETKQMEETEKEQKTVQQSATAKPVVPKQKTLVRGSFSDFYLQLEVLGVADVFNSEMNAVAQIFIGRKSPVMSLHALDTEFERRNGGKKKSPHMHLMDRDPRFHVTNFKTDDEKEVVFLPHLEKTNDLYKRLVNCYIRSLHSAGVTDETISFMFHLFKLCSKNLKNCKCNWCVANDDKSYVAKFTKECDQSMNVQTMHYRKQSLSHLVSLRVGKTESRLTLAKMLCIIK